MARNQRPDIHWPAIENESAQLLSRYIQFNTTNPPGNEAEAISFLADELRARDFEPQILESAPGRANLVTRLSASGEPSAPPCLLYSHADVVPAESDEWSVPPFGGEIRNGFVWGRGALDNKGLGIVFLQALTLLKKYQPLKRDIILLVGADEEAQGRYGVGWLLDHHPDLVQAEYVWDEGGAAIQQAKDDYLYSIAVAEKLPLKVKLVARGTGGHAALPYLDNPHDRLVRALVRIQRWQRSSRLTPVVAEMLRVLAVTQPFPHSFLFANASHPVCWSLLRSFLKTDSLFAPLICNTVTITILNGGQVNNMVPPYTEAYLDIRLLPGENPVSMLQNLRAIVSDEKISVVPEEIPMPHPSTPTDTDFYRTLTEILQEFGPSGHIIPYLTPGATDSRFFRQAGMKSYGFVPMLLDNQELSRVHGVDERVSTSNLRWGIQIVFETLSRL